MLNLPRTTSEKPILVQVPITWHQYMLFGLGGPYSEKLYLGLKNATRGRRQGLCFSLYRPTLSRKIT